MFMNQRFILFLRAGVFYYEDRESGKQLSLRTRDRAEALTLLHAKNESARQPVLNLQMARVYLSASDPQVATRTWQTVMDEIIRTKTGANQARWITCAKSKQFDAIRSVTLITTRAEDLLHVLQKGTVEHQRILAAERNPERKAFYQLCWHLGGSQGDLALLKGEDVDWTNGTVSFFRKKTGVPVLVHLGKEALNVLKDLPAEGLLFPYLASVRAGDRATEFGQRCRRLGIKGVTLHSYRYAWAERAKTAGYPERFAQEALGHNSKAVHRAYARRALVKIPSLEEYEQQAAQKIIAAA